MYCKCLRKKEIEIYWLTKMRAGKNVCRATPDFGMVSDGKAKCERHTSKN